MTRPHVVCRLEAQAQVEKRPKLTQMMRFKPPTLRQSHAMACMMPHGAI